MDSDKPRVQVERLEVVEIGLICRNGEAIIAATSVTPTVTNVTPTVTEALGVTVTPSARVTRRSMSPVKLAAFHRGAGTCSLACVSVALSVDGLTAISAGAFSAVITMGAAPEAGKLVAAAWLTEHWNLAPSLPRLVAMIGVSPPMLPRRSRSPGSYQHAL
jgi:hypothetical protein